MAVGFNETDAGRRDRPVGISDEQEEMTAAAKAARLTGACTARMGPVPLSKTGSAAVAESVPLSETVSSVASAVLSASDDGAGSDLERMIALNDEIVRRSDDFFGYVTPTDFRLEDRHPELFPTNVRPETLAQDAEMKRMAAAGRAGSRAVPAVYFAGEDAVSRERPVNARWYPAPE